VKIKPITNAELDKVKQDIENMNKFIEIDHPVFDDICTPGNVVLIQPEEKNNPHHGIVFPGDLKKVFFTSSTPDPIIVTSHAEYAASYWITNIFKDLFPNSYLGDAKILKVYSTNIDVNKIKNKHDLYDIYKKFNLQFI